MTNQMTNKMIYTLMTLMMFATPVHAEVVEKTVAIVNTELVLESDFRVLESRIGKPGMVDESLLFDKPASSLKGNRKAQLDYLIDEKLLEK